MPKQQAEADTVEGRLADLIEAGDVHILDPMPEGNASTRLTDEECAIIVKALRDRARWKAADITSGESKKRV